MLDIIGWVTGFWHEHRSEFTAPLPRHPFCLVLLSMHASRCLGWHRHHSSSLPWKKTIVHSIASPPEQLAIKSGGLGDMALCRPLSAEQSPRHNRGIEIILPNYTSHCPPCCCCFATLWDEGHVEN